MNDQRLDGPARVTEARRGGPGLKGKGVGEHLGCSPCGKVAGRALRGIGGPGPEVLLSLLPELTRYYTATRNFQVLRILGAAAFRV